MVRRSRCARWVIWPSILISLFGLTGCWDAVETNDLAIAIAAALDSAPGNQIRFTEQIVVPGQLNTVSQPGGQGGGKPYFTVSTTGLDLGDALQNIQMKLSRRLFVSHRRLLLISEKFARGGIRRSLDELTRNPQSRLRTGVVLTKGRALDLLKVPYPLEREPSAGLRQIVFGPTSDIELDLKGLAYMLSTPGSQAVLPVVTLRPPSVPGSSARFEMTGIGILHDGRFVGEMTEFEAEGVLWLREEMRRRTITMNIPGQHGPISCQLLRTQSDFKVEIQKGIPALKIHLRPEGDVIENDTNLDLNNPKNVEIVEHFYSKEIERAITRSLYILQHRYDSDVVLFNERVHRAFPGQWPTWEQHWDKVFARIPVTVDVSGKIRRIGMTGAPLTRLKNEVKQ